uniref:Uncharacterized protein n=1 Tax=Anopheles dirus TaxID=7168 RepID=A0A182NWX0_9DIPT
MSIGERGGESSEDWRLMCTPILCFVLRGEIPVVWLWW